MADVILLLIGKDLVVATIHIHLVIQATRIYWSIATAATQSHVIADTEIYIGPIQISFPA